VTSVKSFEGGAHAERQVRHTASQGAAAWTCMRETIGVFERGIGSWTTGWRRHKVARDLRVLLFKDGGKEAHGRCPIVHASCIMSGARILLFIVLYMYFLRGITGIVT
jgi:hypothetical protein